jgi:hypothetical protein
MAYYLDFFQLQCSLVTFGIFKSLPQHFGLFQNGTKCKYKPIVNISEKLNSTFKNKTKWLQNFFPIFNLWPVL